MNSTTTINEATSFIVLDFSYPVYIVFSVLLVCSGTLSIIGSGIILVKILRDRAQNNGSTTPYDRIIFCLSCGDIFATIYYAIFPFLVAIASPSSCQAIGVLGVLSNGATWYNGLLSFYFLLTILSQVRRKNFVQRCEPWMHLSVMYFPIVAILVYSCGWSRPNDLGTTCEIDPIIAPIASIPVVFAFLSMIVNYSVIYAVVRKSLKSSNESSENPVKTQLLRESTSIMVLYVGCYLVTWLPLFVLALIGRYSGVDYENREGFNLGTLLFAGVLASWRFLWAMLMPLQGFFNAIIYLRPFYIRFRAANPNKSKWFVLHKAVFNSKAPRLDHRRVANHITYTSDVVITDATLAEDTVVNPNEALFYPGRLSYSTDSPSNDIAEESKEED